MHKYIVIDIGGTNIRVGVVENNTVIKKWSFKTNKNDAIESLAPVLEIINQLNAEYAGACMPGPADYDHGIIINSPNLKGSWTNFDIKKHLLNNSNLKDAWFENDANVMALGNHFAYGLSAKDITQFFTISTGLGAGLIYKNEIFAGVNHFAQEVAQAPISTKNGETPLGVGALEYYSSGSGIETQISKIGYEVSTKQIFGIYDLNPHFKEVIDEGISTLARTFAIVMAFQNPNYFIVGGSVAINNWWYVERAFEKAKLLTAPEQYRNVQLLKDKFGDDSALIGLDYFAKYKKINQN